MSLSVQCPCGYRVVGSEQAIVSSMQEHCSTSHAADISPDAVVAFAREVAPSRATATATRLLGLVATLLQESSTTPPVSTSTAVETGDGPPVKVEMTPIASIDLSTRGFMEAEHVGEYFVTLQVDNLRSCLLSVSGPDYNGYYNLSRITYNQQTCLVDDEGTLVPVSVMRLRHPKNYSVVRIEIWPKPIESLPRLAPYMRNPFK